MNEKYEAELKALGLLQYNNARYADIWTNRMDLHRVMFGDSKWGYKTSKTLSRLEIEGMVKRRRQPGYTNRWQFALA